MGNRDLHTNLHAHHHLPPTTSTSDQPSHRPLPPPPANAAIARTTARKTGTTTSNTATGNAPGAITTPRNRIPQPATKTSKPGVTTANAPAATTPKKHIPQTTWITHRDPKLTPNTIHTNNNPPTTNLQNNPPASTPTNSSAKPAIRSACRRNCSDAKPWKGRGGGVVAAAAKAMEEEGDWAGESVTSTRMNWKGMRGWRGRGRRGGGDDGLVFLFVVFRGAGEGGGADFRCVSAGRR